MSYKEYDFKSRYLEVFGSNMHYVEAGAGPTILFLHGTPSWSYVWRHIIANMQKSARCIAVDMIGHGKSDFPAIEYNQDNQFKYLSEFIRKMELQDFIVVGHSYGANLGAWYARANQNRIKGLAYLEPMLGAFSSWQDFNPYNPQAQEFFKKLRDPELGLELIVNDNIFMQAFSRSSLTPPSEEFLLAINEPFLERKRRKVLWDGGPRNLPIKKKPLQFCQTVDENLSWIKEGNLPQLIFYTEPAAFFTREKVETIISNTPRMTGYFLGEGRYLHMEDYPEEICHFLTTWMRGISGDR